MSGKDGRRLWRQAERVRGPVVGRTGTTYVGITFRLTLR